ncbi:hypothetical protein QWY28_12540 [Nocardioides sp. SOB77]|uniref:DUF3558 domain-containing protein n=1 Tax=Nocardioides oceani TaxID=3058369 RepID=A0ABT8FGG4_9ACTN|nr:hypothetical protein [Nocardioides oceani]
MPTGATAILAAWLLAATSACAGGAEEPEQVSTASVDELSDHGGRACPERLAQADDESHGFGTDAPATEVPDLSGADRAWVCTYRGVLDHRQPRGGGAVYRWERLDRPQSLTGSRSEAVEQALAGVAPYDDGERLCTADLGPRHVLVLAHGRDLTGVVVEGYGCRDVRLTDDPFTTVPGEGDQGRAVPGVLGGGGDLLDAVGVERPLR